MSSTDDLGGSGGGGEDFLGGLFGDRHSSPDDLFELVWRGAATAGQPICKPLSSRRPFAAAAPVPEWLELEVAPSAAPPSEAEMASWLFPIVCGAAEFAGGGDAVVVAGLSASVEDDQMVPSLPGKKEPAADHKLQDKRKATGGRRSHHQPLAHSLTEKRRRCKIKERFKTLQQLVPGCNNSNQASTLDQTIRYMKSLQQHIQAMSSFRCGMKPTSSLIRGSVPSCATSPLPSMLATEHIGAAGMALGRSPPSFPGFSITTLQP